MTVPEEDGAKYYFPKNLYFMNNMRYLVMELKSIRWEAIDL